MSEQGAEAIDGTVVEVQLEEARAAVVPMAGPTSLAVTPAVEAAELVQRLAVIEEAANSAMKEGTDYGRVPGTDKNALFKPGAEKLSVLFQLDVQLDNEKHFDGNHLTVVSKATVYHAPTGSRIGYGEGLCTTREKKYAKRQASRRCPECHKETIIKGKEEYGGGWICFYKKGGCGTKFDDADKSIVDQDVGEIENPDLPDTWNTVVKMAEKRARVGAVLAVTGASAKFTQDLDEQGDADVAEAPGLPVATEEQMGQLRAALEYILPETEAQRVWQEIKDAFGGGLYGPAAIAAIAPIRALKAIHDDEHASQEDAEIDERVAEVAGRTGAELREAAAAEAAGKMAGEE